MQKNSKKTTNHRIRKDDKQLSNKKSLWKNKTNSQTREQPLLPANTFCPFKTFPKGIDSIDELLKQNSHYTKNYQLVEEILVELSIQEDKLLKEIKGLPTGKFISNKNGDYTKWFLTKGKKRTFLPHTEKTKAQRILLREFKEFLLKNVQLDEKLLSSYLDHKALMESEFMQRFKSSKDYVDLLGDCFGDVDAEILEWIMEPFHPNELYPEHLIHETKSNILVRSKSEVLIADALYENNIPFKYECPLVLNGGIYYPDFTCMNPFKKKIFYWEHFGMLDDLNYAGKTIAKESLYINNGIIPSIQLITTYETKEYPLVRKAVQRNIDSFLLST